MAKTNMLEKAEASVKSAKAAQKSAAARWTKAIPAEAAAYREAQTGEQLARVKHFDALTEVSAAGRDVQFAASRMAAAQAELKAAQEAEKAD